MCGGRVSVVAFSKSSQSMDLTVDRKVGAKQESTGKTINGGIKKAGGALRPAGLNFKRRQTNSYLPETIAQTSCYG